MTFTRRLGFFLTPVLLLTGAATTARAQSYPERPVLAMKSSSADFRALVAKIRSPATKPIPDVDLRRSDTYFRLTQKAYVLNHGVVDPTNVLGGTPYVFLTVPEAGFGRSLYDLYADLGYTATDVLNQRKVKMVALVVRYQDRIKFSDVRDADGPLKQADFKNYVYTPTWANGMQLFARLAAVPFPANPTKADQYLYLNLPKNQQQLAMYFQQQRRERIARLPYRVLRMEGGSDWQYRQLLETSMSMNSHFRGVGRTENTLHPASDQSGLPEFVGPNLMLSDLKDYAVIDMGQLEFVESHNKN